MWNILFFGFSAQLLDQWVGNLLVRCLGFLSDDFVHTYREILETFEIFAFLDFFWFGRSLRGLKVPLFLFLDRVFLVFVFLLFTEQTLIFLEFKSSSDGLDLIFGKVPGECILLIEMKIISVLSGWVEWEEEHWGLGGAIERGMNLLDGRGHEIGLVGGLI